MDAKHRLIEYVMFVYHKLLRNYGNRMVFLRWLYKFDGEFRDIDISGCRERCVRIVIGVYLAALCGDCKNFGMNYKAQHFTFWLQWYTRISGVKYMENIRTLGHAMSCQTFSRGHNGWKMPSNRFWNFETNFLSLICYSLMKFYFKSF